MTTPRRGFRRILASWLLPRSRCPWRSPESWRHRQLTPQPVADRQVVVRLGSSGSPAPRPKAVEATGLTTVPNDEFGHGGAGADAAGQLGLERGIGRVQVSPGARVGGGFPPLPRRKRDQHALVAAAARAVTSGATRATRRNKCVIPRKTRCGGPLPPFRTAFPHRAASARKGKTAARRAGTARSGRWHGRRDGVGCDRHKRLPGQGFSGAHAGTCWEFAPLSRGSG
jgi:hypothetical protein